jgi:hypothetical protein
MPAYQRGTSDDMDRFTYKLQRLEERVRITEGFSGTQLAGTTNWVRTKLAELRATVTDLVNTALANFYTKAEIDSKVAAPGGIAPDDVVAAGDVSAGGSVSGTTGTFNGGLKSTDVYSRSVTYGGTYTATWTHQDGTMGTAPSSERFKQDITPAQLDLTALERAEVVEYRYRDAVHNRGDEAEVRLGGIAEQFVAAGLRHVVTFDEHGQPFTIEDRPLLYTLLAGYQRLAERIREIEKAES